MEKKQKAILRLADDLSANAMKDLATRIIGALMVQGSPNDAERTLRGFQQGDYSIVCLHAELFREITKEVCQKYGVEYPQEPDIEQEA